MQNVLNKETIESIYECATDILATVGVEFGMSSARELFKKNGAKKAIQLIKEIKEDDKNSVMGQGICSIAPLSYDEDSLINLTVLVEEKQDITIFPCTLSFMTGPESLMGIVIHDIALSLAGAVYVQLLKPGTNVNFSSFSTMTDMRTMQPVYGSPEYLHTQIMFYEVCLHYEMSCALCGCFSEQLFFKRRNEYQC